MADYIYLLENRLSTVQQRALATVRNLSRSKDLTLFLTGGAVRDLTGGGSVRDLDITVQGDVAPMRKDLEEQGAIFVGENTPAQALFFRFPGGIRVEVSSAVSVTYPKPGQPKYEPASIAEDLRRRDFTANAMALSLNEGSYGLLMDPLNGVADIENRELRLVNNYGFLEDPSRMVRAARLSSRLGWQMEERTRQRYSNAKQEQDVIAALSNFSRGYELEEIFHEEDPLRIMRALEAEGWLQVLAPEMILGKANESALADLRERQGQLQTQGIRSDGAALAFPLLVAKLSPPDAESLKAKFVRPGFVTEIETLEERTRELQTVFGGKDASIPSVAWRILHEAEPELVLSLFYSAKSPSIQGRIKTFLNDSPTARQRLPYALLQEMRITPDLPQYHDLLDRLFFELMDGKLGTTEELKAYLEPFSPPAPPPPVNLRRARAKKEPRASRAKAKKAPATVAEQEEGLGVSEGLMEPGTLTGLNRGTEPDAPEVLEGKVAPLVKGEAEPSAAAARPKRPVKVTAAPATPAATPAAAAPATIAPAAKLSAKPAPAPEAEALQPHPMATKDIAKKITTLAPQQQAATAAPGPNRGKDRAETANKPVSVAPPARTAAKTTTAIPAKTAAKTGAPALKQQTSAAPSKSTAARPPAALSEKAAGKAPLGKTNAAQKSATPSRTSPAAKSDIRSLAKSTSASKAAPAAKSTKTPVRSKSKPVVNAKSKTAAPIKDKLAPKPAAKQPVKAAAQKTARAVTAKQTAKPKNNTTKTAGKSAKASAKAGKPGKRL